MCFFFKQKTAYEMRISDWSSDVCSSDLQAAQHAGNAQRDREGQHRHPHLIPPGGHAYGRRGVAPVVLIERHAGGQDGEQQEKSDDQRVADDRQPRSEEHTSELQSLMRISYAVFFLHNKTTDKINNHLKHSDTTEKMHTYHYNT